MIIQASTILLTGETGGIGRCIATALANHGANLILVGRNEEQLAALKNALANPESHDVVIADIATTEGLRAITERAKQNKVDALINNAGTNHFSLLSHTSLS